MNEGQFLYAASPMQPFSPGEAVSCKCPLGVCCLPSGLQPDKPARVITTYLDKTFVLFDGRSYLVPNMCVHPVSSDYSINEVPALLTSALEAYRVRRRIGDALVCHRHDGIIEDAAPVLIAVNRTSRMVNSETIDDKQWIYTYDLANTLNPTRVARSGSISKGQVLYPAYPDGCMIHAMKTDASGVRDGNNREIKLMEVSTRCWVRGRVGSRFDK